MEALRRTRIWRSAFTEPRADATAEEQAYFRTNFEEMRERVAPIVARILRDMPSYTVHDISHLDALWETASLVAGDGLLLNPPEAFVFGGAVLLHDAAMTLAAYPGGLEELQATTQWKDAVALRGIGDNEIDDDSRAQIVSDVLRILHARRAADLAVKAWHAPKSLNENGHTQEYLIEGNDLRNFYGPTIGKIAYSHWWPISKVERELSVSLGGMPPRTANTIDVLKIAALLRVADALHLDRRRAPPFVRALDRPTGVSALHWDFQGRLAFPHIDRDAVTFTAGEPCPVEGADGWWLAFDALALADRELRDTDLLLQEHGREGLRARRVNGANNPRELSKFIPVVGWTPVETQIRISDVPQIVQTLGGDKLYGSDATVPLRELIQNALDAIQARRRLQGRPDWGRVLVSLEDRDGSSWLVVEDDGVGMSEHVLTGELLDFGASLWRASSVTEEFPGLASRGMKAIGRFGIGFFSVFMIADQVTVTSRRYDRAASEGLTLSFKHGIGSRPILTHPEISHLPLDGGTKIELKLIHDPRGQHGLKFTSRESRPKTPYDDIIRGRSAPTGSLAELVAGLAPTSDVRLLSNEFGKESKAVEPDDWKTIPAHLLRGRLGADGGRRMDQFLDVLMQPIVDETGVILGRAALWPSVGSWDQGGALTSGGMRIQSLSHLIGVVRGEVTTAARDLGSATLPPAALSRWATQQGRIIRSLRVDDGQKASSAEIILECGGSIGQLPIVSRAREWLTSTNLRRRLKSEKVVQLYMGDVDHEDEDDVSKSNFDSFFEPNEEIYFLPVVGDAIFSTRTDLWHRRRTSLLLKLFENIIEQVWGGFVEMDDSESVGQVKYEDIMRSITIYHRPED